MTTITLQTNEKQKLETVKEFLKKLKIPFKELKDEDAPYNPEFVAKIERSRQQAKEGKGRTISLDEIWK